MSPEAKRPWRGTVIVLIVATCWYGLVLTCLPTMTGGFPTLPGAAQARLMSHFCLVSAGQRRFDEFSPIIGPVRSGNSYHLVLFKSAEGKQSIIAYPHYAWQYAASIFSRMLFLDFAKHEYPSYMLRDDGMLCDCAGYPFDSEHPPTAADAAPDSGRWDCYKLESLNPASSTAPAGR